MESSKQADLLLLTTIGIFIILTFFAFLMHEGKELVVVPVKQKLREVMPCVLPTLDCKLFTSNKKEQTNT